TRGYGGSSPRRPRPRPDPKPRARGDRCAATRVTTWHELRRAREDTPGPRARAAEKTTTSSGARPVRALARCSASTLTSPSGQPQARRKAMEIETAHAGARERAELLGSARREHACSFAPRHGGAASKRCGISRRPGRYRRPRGARSVIEPENGL